MDDEDLIKWLMLGTAEPNTPRWPSWMLQATCLSADPAVFFPDRGESLGPARRICGACPVQSECLDFVMAEEHGELRSHRSGVWAGLSPAERVALEQRQSRVAAAA